MVVADFGYILKYMVVLSWRKEVIFINEMIVGELWKNIHFHAGIWGDKNNVNI